jgi:RNA polymerase sigma factor (TIGR02999 family)
MARMSDVTRLLAAINDGDQLAMAELLPVVYDELRRLAHVHMIGERADHTLEPTALVHEAYLRLIGGDNPHWDGRGHFFGAAAEAMRRILVDHARAKNAVKRSGQRQRVGFDHDAAQLPSGVELVDVLALDEGLAKLAAEAPAKAELVKLRYFAGLNLEEFAAVMGISLATAKRYWVYAKAWLFKELKSQD